MVTYIVHLAVRYEAHDEYVQWLRNEHIQEVLRIPGFMRAELLLKKGGSMESSSREVKMIYTVSDEAAIKTYFAEFAMPMREKGLEKFPGMFSAQREVWLETENFTVK